MPSSELTAVTEAFDLDWARGRAPRRQRHRGRLRPVRGAPADHRRHRPPGVRGAYADVTMLSIDQIAAYHRDGFLAIEDFATPAMCRGPEGAGQRDRRRVRADRAPHGLHDRRAGAHVSNREFLDSGAGIWCFFEAEAFDDARRADAGQGAEHQQDRPRHARPRPGVRVVQLHAGSSPGRRRRRSRRPAGAAEHVHLQAAAHRRRGRTATRTRRSSTPTRSPSPGSGSPSRTPRSENGCLWAQPGGHRGPLRRQYRRAPRARRRRHPLRRARRHADADAAARPRADRRPGRDDWWCSTACCRTGATSTGHRSAATPTACTASPPSAEYPSWNWLQRGRRAAVAPPRPGGDGRGVSDRPLEGRRRLALAGRRGCADKETPDAFERAGSSAH